VLRSTRAWLLRDLEVLRPVFDRMRVEGPDFLQNNAALADEIEGQLKKAGTAIDKAQTLTTKYRTRLSGLCESAVAGQKMPSMSEGKSLRAGAGVSD
jgi:hypothetical protein